MSAKIARPTTTSELPLSVTDSIAAVFLMISLLCFSTGNLVIRIFSELFNTRTLDHSDVRRDWKDVAIDEADPAISHPWSKSKR